MLWYGVRKILIIEDDGVVRDVLRSFLDGNGFEPTLAGSGEAGLNLLHTDRFDLLLTDLVMPGISGMDVLKAAVATGTGVPIIVMTAFGTQRTAVEAMRHGAFNYITKPFNLDELLIVLEKALSVSKLQQENVMLKLRLEKESDLKKPANDVPRMMLATSGVSSLSPVSRTTAVLSARCSITEFGDSGVNLNEMMSTMERNLIQQALERAGGVRTKAAQLLGLNRTTLIEKIKKMGINQQKK